MRKKIIKQLVFRTNFPIKYPDPHQARGIYFAKYYGGGGGERMAAGEKNEKEGKRGKGKRRKRA